MSANATAKRPFERGLANTQRVESVAVATNNAATARPGRSLQNKHAKNAADATMPAFLWNVQKTGNSTLIKYAHNDSTSPYSCAARQNV